MAVVAVRGSWSRTGQGVLLGVVAVPTAGLRTVVCCAEACWVDLDLGVA